MKKTLQQIIREDFNKSYKCDLKAEDVIAKTDYFKKSTVVESKAMICSDDSANLEDSLSVGTSLQEERPINSTKLITCKEELDDEVSNEEETEQCEIKKPSNKFLFYQRAFSCLSAGTLRPRKELPSGGGSVACLCRFLPSLCRRSALCCTKSKSRGMRSSARSLFSLDGRRNRSSSGRQSAVSVPESGLEFADDPSADRKSAVRRCKTDRSFCLCHRTRHTVCGRTETIPGNRKL